MNLLTFGSLFSGAGGLDLGLECAGFKCTFQVENDKHCIEILTKHWPNVPKNEIRSCVGLVGGDPCPIRSTLGRISGSSTADMSGYFLAMAARLKPRWILRENVVAPDVVEFKSGLEVLGYTGVVIETNSMPFTGQSRARQIVVAFNTKELAKRFLVLVQKEANSLDDEAGPESVEAAKCLDTRGRSACSFSQNYVYEKSTGAIRSFTHTERELLQGWPSGWTDGVSNAARQRMTGNGVTSPMVEYFGNIIMDTLTELCRKQQS